MIEKLAYLALCALALTVLCAQGLAAPPADPDSDRKGLDEARMGAGFRALDAMCLGCHGVEASPRERLAPAMAAIKRHYVGEGTTYARFRSELGRFVGDPSARNARMNGAVRRFGLMPVLGVDEALLDEIAYYVYHSPLERPDWLAAHYAGERRRYEQSSASAPTSEADHLAHGLQIAMRTKAELGSNLKRALASGGPVPAIAFCSERAVPIAEEMSARLGASIRRVSDRPRNPDNRAQGPELDYIGSAKAALADGHTVRPRLREIDGRVTGYYPIVTNGMCLQCHGTPGQEVAEETLDALDTRYPDDMALGYRAEELRGIWVISMDPSGSADEG